MSGVHLFATIAGDAVPTLFRRQKLRVQYAVLVAPAVRDVASNRFQEQIQAVARYGEAVRSEGKGSFSKSDDGIRCEGIRDDIVGCASFFFVRVPIFPIVSSQESHEGVFRKARPQRTSSFFRIAEGERFRSFEQPGIVFEDDVDFQIHLFRPLQTPEPRYGESVSSASVDYAGTVVYWRSRTAATPTPFLLECIQTSFVSIVGAGGSLQRYDEYAIDSFFLLPQSRI
mmetsp:Transcript_27188/g.56620  ORF Transcript_27188/g.56620 Transcript_27188/m.56620 type:complete len:228 (+) Transcript_27188:295-978(+)